MSAMKKEFALFVILVILLAACAPSDNQKQIDQLFQKMDSLNAVVQSLKSNSESDSISPAKTFEQKEESRVHAAQSPQPLKRQPTASEKEKPKSTDKLTKPGGEVTVHHYKGLPLRISARISAWGPDGKRQGQLYDPKGNLTFEWEDISHSYSSVSHISSFHPNGAAAKISVSFNPGASMYWYESDITFDINNQPQWKVERTMPPRGIEDAGGQSFFWSNGQWVPQEAIREQPVPGE